MSSCEHFTENSWRPDLCTTCQRARSEHTGPRSWRRKSEPNPNNTITGVRISALASKFQTTSTEVDQRAKTLDRKVTRKAREIKLSTSRSIENIDSASSSPAVTSSSSSGTVVDTDSNKQTEASSLIPHSKVSKDHTQGGISATSILQTTHDVTDTDSQPSTTVGRPKLAGSLTNSSQATARSSVTNCSQTRLTNNNQARVANNGQATVKSATTNKSQATAKSTITKSNLAQHSGSELVKKLSTSHVPPPSLSLSSSAFKSQQTTKDGQSVKGEVSRSKRRVSIPDLQPEVIGHDGGLDNLFPQDESVLEEEESEEQISLSLTDEEKQFALLALSNTIWNSDIKNLQVETDSTLSSVREFEDLCVDELWSKTRFKSLVCSDPEPKHKNFGTFPQVSSSRQGRISLENLSFGQASRVPSHTLQEHGTTADQASRAVPHTLQEHCTRLAHTVEMSARMSSSRRQMSARSSGGHLLSSADSEGKLNCGSSGSSGDSGVEMAACVDPHLSYTVGNITDCLYRSSDGLMDAGVGATDKANQLHDGGIQSPPQIRARSLSAEKRPESGVKLVNKKVTCPASAGTSVEDDDVSEGFHAVDLLNEVLKDYTDMNESSTDDLDVKDVLRAKKCSEFEARMASVAATLDLTKPQQRGKRQAPRPPVSPPPEPNLAPGVSPKKVSNQPDPVFKMVTVGKSIVTVPAQQDLNHSKPAIVPYALEDFGSLPEASDGSNKTNGDGKGKKGITSFFRNILRRGKDSTDSFESINPEVHLSVKPERKDSTVGAGGTASVDLPDEGTVSPPSCDEHKVAPRFSPQAKFLVMPPTSPPQKCVDTDTVAQDDAAARSEVDTQQQQQEEGQASVPDTPSQPAPETASGTSSPLSQRKASRGLASPKMMLKRATAKFSPPTSRHARTQDKESDVTTSAVAKPYPAPKPVVPPPAKPSAAVSLSSEATLAGGVVKEASCVARESEPPQNPNVVRRRAKSPKRTAPPVPPTRTSVGAAAKSVSTDSRNVDLAKELEQRLRKSSADQSGGGTLSRSELRESTRRSMPVPPSPPSERKEKSAANSPPVSPIQERDSSLPSSPSSPTGAFDFTNTEWSGGSTSTVDDDLPKFAEKIELPTVATQARKGFLGKLGGNRKTKAPQPPSVKRAKSVTQSSTLPRGEKKSKKINVADISGPVMVTDVSNNSRVLENRRNTISLGDEPAFVAMAAANKLAGGTTSSTSLDKSGFDEFDFPVLSPLGSLENLYESILPKPEGTLFHYYDPPTSPKVLCPNIPSDGYLEPVPPLSSTLTARAALSTSSATSISAASSLTAITTTLSSSSSSSTTTNISTTKSPMKSRTSPKGDRTSSHSANVKDSGSSQTSSSQASTSSSEINSRENSGGSLPDQPPSSSRGSAGDTPAKLTAAAPSSPLPAAGLGPNFVEPELTEQRRILLASQPIYEEIPNGGNEELDDEEDLNDDDRKVLGLKTNLPSRIVDSVPRVGPPSTGLVVDPSKKAHSWLQQSHSMGAQSSSSVCVMPLVGAVPSSPSHAPSKPIQPPSTTSLSASMCMTSSQMMSSSLMTTSMTSSMLPPPPPPPDHLPAPQPPASRSVSRETVSSESDTQSNCSTLSRPRPAPRRKPKRPDTGGSDQYVSMNRPNAQVSLSEDKLRDVFSKLTGITFHALQDIYAQCEKILSVDRLDIPNSKLLKWADFDIYGQPLHASGRCVVYNAKLRANNSPCQIMILHSRPATEMCTTSHPSLLRPSAVFADTIPFSFLTPDFIKTSQLLQNSVYDSSQARCFLAVGAFDVVESLDSHLARLRETMAQDLNSYLNVMLTAALQLLSAMSHCLDQGFFVTETDYNDVFLITRADLRGKVVAFLPHQRSIDVAQGEAMCNFLDRLLTDAMPADDDDDIDDNDDEDDGDDDDDDDGEEEGARIVSAPKKVVSKLRSMLEARRVECLGHVRTAVEYLLWGPTKSELPLSPVGTGPKAVTKSGSSGGGRASREQELYVWLEKERVSTVGRLARNVPGLGAGLSLEEFYTLKFLLKSSAGCLAESLRRLSR